MSGRGPQNIERGFINRPREGMLQEGNVDIMGGIPIGSPGSPGEGLEIVGKEVGGTKSKKRKKISERKNIMNMKE